MEDNAILLKIIAGRDPHDPTSSDVPVHDYASALTGEVRGLRLGVPKNYFFEHCDPEIAEGVRKAIGSLEKLGARVEEIVFPHTEEIMAHSQVILFAESASVHMLYLKEKPGSYDPRVRERLEAGRYVTATEYLQALRVRARIARDVIQEVFVKG